jgi:hypothetical protein
MTRSTFDKAGKDMANLARGCSKSPCLYDLWFTNVKFAGGLLAHPEDYARILTPWSSTTAAIRTGSRLFPIKT